MKSCFPSGLKCRHGSVKIPNFWCQVSHQLQINHPQHSVEATVSLSVSNSSCCALSLSNGGGLIIHISVLTGGTEDTGLQQPPALSLYKCLFALSVLLECPFKHFYSTALTSLKKKKREWKELHTNWHAAKPRSNWNYNIFFLEVDICMTYTDMLRKKQILNASIMISLA